MFATCPPWSLSGGDEPGQQEPGNCTESGAAVGIHVAGPFQRGAVLVVAEVENTGAGVWLKPWVPCCQLLGTTALQLLCLEPSFLPRATGG